MLALTTIINNTFKYINRYFNDTSEVFYTGNSYNLESAPFDVPLVLTDDWKNAGAGTVIMKMSRKGFQFIYPDSHIIDTGNKEYLCCILCQSKQKKSKLPSTEGEDDGYILKEVSKYKYEDNAKYIWDTLDEIEVKDKLDLALLNTNTVTLKLSYHEVLDGSIKFIVEKESEDSIKLHLTTRTYKGYKTYAYTSFTPSFFTSRIVDVNDLGADKLYKLLDRIYAHKATLD